MRIVYYLFGFIVIWLQISLIQAKGVNWQFSKLTWQYLTSLYNYDSFSDRHETTFRMNVSNFLFMSAFKRQDPTIFTGDNLEVPATCHGSVTGTFQEATLKCAERGDHVLSLDEYKNAEYIDPSEWDRLDSTAYGDWNLAGNLNYPVWLSDCPDGMQTKVSNHDKGMENQSSTITCALHQGRIIPFQSDRQGVICCASDYHNAVNISDLTDDDFELDSSNAFRVTIYLSIMFGVIGFIFTVPSFFFCSSNSTRSTSANQALDVIWSFGYGGHFILFCFLMIQVSSSYRKSWRIGLKDPFTKPYLAGLDFLCDTWTCMYPAMFLFLLVLSSRRDSKFRLSNTIYYVVAFSFAFISIALTCFLVWLNFYRDNISFSIIGTIYFREVATFESITSFGWHTLAIILLAVSSHTLSRAIATDIDLVMDVTCFLGGSQINELFYKLVRSICRVFIFYNVACLSSFLVRWITHNSDTSWEVLRVVAHNMVMMSSVFFLAIYFCATQSESDRAPRVDEAFSSVRLFPPKDLMRAPDSGSAKISSRRVSLKRQVARKKNGL